MEDQESRLVTSASISSLKAVQRLMPWGSEIRRPRIESDHSAKSSVDNRNERSYSSAAPYVIMAWSIIKGRNSFTFRQTYNFIIYDI
jgi:hypothetical protein